MMTQTAAAGEKHFVSTMIEHMDLCTQMARAYGNDRFEPIKPADEVLYAIANHDRGWDEYDQSPMVDQQTGLPFIMAKTPPAEAVKTNSGSPNFNEANNPYSGLLSSMHTWGLYNKRYGFSRFALRIRPDSVSVPVLDVNRKMIDSMLEGEVKRQQRLKQKLAENPRTKALLEEPRLFQNYKQLQFFDTLSLYFHLVHAGDRGNETYICVPMSAEADATVEVKELGDGSYSLDPFPFVGDKLTLVCRGRYTGPLPAGRDRSEYGAMLRALPPDSQTYNLVPA
jgi:hypothetical protein